MPSTMVAADRAAGPAPEVRLKTNLLTLPEVRWAGASLILFLLGAGAGLLDAPAWVSWTLYAGCYLAGGWEPALAGLQALREKTLDVDLLMIVAALGAAAIGQVFDGGLLIVIFATSGALEAVATKRTEDSVRALLTLAPERATRLRPDGTEEVVEAASLEVGDLILVRPGERISADGMVIDGSSEVDQASITGEPMPVHKTHEDEVYAGTLNGAGALRIRVGRPAADWVIARIVSLVEEASATKARTQLFIEKVEQRYSVGVVVATLALFFGPLAFGADLTETLLRAMTFMIVASPCAVVLATMPPLLSAIANAGRHGVLVKSAVVMEKLGTTTRVAFDKTGTLTEGTPRLVELHTAPGITPDELLTIAASAERPSEHVVGRAVVAAAQERGLSLEQAEDFRAVPGRGVHARVGDQQVEVGSPALLGDLDEEGGPARAGRAAGDGASDTAGDAAGELDRWAATTLRTCEDAGHTAIVVRLDGKPAGVLALADQPRPAAASTVAALAELTGRPPVLLTGDNPRAAAHLAEAVGVTEVRAGLLPQDKVTEVERLQKAGDHVLVVGDGVNDAPALAAAHLGVAMGRAGSDLTLQTADAIVVRDELATVPAAIRLSQRARRVVTQNLVIAGTFIVILVAWDLFGDLPLPLGVAGHEGSTVLVGLNGLRLLRAKAWR
ncbi:heavy metal translocating P-type ATPase [Actinopolymorpha alba]|uniref:heavy metal translocating P-type ATPase n=1 Tax=Actinopolymorpha alba TaxID=533267 RepID=UPI00035F39EE|nr:heavy metal translocating P-type ATPase [Actinopolymorpha alba]